MEIYIILLEQKNQYIVKEIIPPPKAVPIKLPMAFFRTGTNVFLISIGIEKTLNSQKIILRKNYRAGGIMLSDFRLYYKATVSRM